MVGESSLPGSVPRLTCCLRSVAAFALALSAARAQVVIDNTPPTTTGGTTLNAVEWKALLLTSGDSSYRVDSIQLGLNPPTGSTAPGTWNVQVSLFQVALGVPTAQIATLGLAPVSIASATQVYTFTPTSSFNLAPRTAYALVVASDAAGIRWSNRSGSTPTAAEGFDFGGFAATTDSGATWVTSGIGTQNAVRLEVTAVPEPAAATALVAVGLVLSAGMARRFRGVA